MPRTSNVLAAACLSLTLACASNGVDSGGDAATPVGSGGGFGSGGSGSGGSGSGGMVADIAPAGDSGPASMDAAAQGPCTAGTLKPGNTTVMIPSGGSMRSYILHVPPKYDGKTRLPLVIDMHGKGGTGQGEMGSGWLQKADAVGIVMMYPDGLYNSWNGGPAGCPTLVCCCQPSQDHNIIGPELSSGSPFSRRTIVTTTGRILDATPVLPCAPHCWPRGRRV